MAGPANMTYASLMTDAPSYLERLATDVNLNAQLPRLLMLAENRVATDTRILGTLKVVTNNLIANNPVIAKPSLWRRSLSMNYTDTIKGPTQFFLRAYEFCRSFSSSNVPGAPRYYADYDFYNFFVSPTPDQAYAFEHLYIQKLPPLGDAQQTNWLTDNAPQLLLAALLLECEIWLKNQSRIPQRQGTYKDLLGALVGEDKSRVADRNVVFDNGE